MPGAKLLEEFYRACTSNPGIKIFEGCILPVGIRTAFNYECPVNLDGGVFWTCNLMVEKELFFRVKGFDEDYPFASMEDVDFRNKFVRNEKTIFLKDAVVWHPWKFVKNPYEKFERAYLSHIIFLEKWPDKRKDFDIFSAIKKVLYNLKDDVIPNFFAYRGVGISYIFAFYKFLFKLALTNRKINIV